MNQRKVLKKLTLLFLSFLLTTVTFTEFTGGFAVAAANVDYSKTYTWSSLPTNNHPLAGTAPLMAYDPINKNVILFGGVAGSRNNQTWRWDSNGWTQLNPATTPLARSGGGLAYDPVTQKLIMYGGDGGGTDTWSWDGTNWTKLTPAHNPGVRRIPYMATAPSANNVAGGIVLFGGLDTNSGNYGDTWLWNGTDWTQASPTTSPSARSFGQIAYDSQLKQTVLFGGVSGNTFLNDTWTWDGTNWTQVITSGSVPSARAGGGMVYDGTHIVLAGGDVSGSPANDTWIYSNGNWSKQTLNSSFTARGHLAMTYDAQEEQTIVFGGFTANGLPTDTWALEKIAQLNTGTAEKITTATADVYGELTDLGKAAVIEKGIEITNGDDTYRFAAADTNLGGYTISATGLTSDTGYTYRAYAIDAHNNTSYGDIRSFKTKKVSPLLLDSYEYKLRIGETHKTVVQSTYGDDNTLFTVTDGVTFKSQEPAVALVDESGIVQGIAEGNTVITAVYNGVTAEAAVHVYFVKPEVVKISSDSNAVTLEKGKTQTTVVRAVYDDGTSAIIQNGVTYQSSDENVATVDSNGVITAHSKGSAKITVTYMDQTFTIDVTVKNKDKDDSTNSNSTSGGGGTSTPTLPTLPTTEPNPETIKDPTTGDPIAVVTKQDKEGKKVSNITVDSQKAIDSLEKSNRNTLVIQSNDDSGTINTQVPATLAKWLDEKNGSIELQAPIGRYILPAKQLGVNELIARNNAAASLAQLNLNVTVSAASTSAEQAIQNAAASKNYSVVGSAINFNVTSSYNGTESAIPNFDQYAERLVRLPGGYDPSRITTGIIYDQSQTSFMHVPTKVVQIDGEYYAKINSLVSNGTYALIWNQKTFADTTNHWGKAAIDNMASRLVIEGVTDTTFDPNRDITRAEFAAIAVRAFGLQDTTATGQSFSDVNDGAWYSSYVDTASAYGLLNGYNDGTFKPSQNISRQEATAILIRATKLANLNTTAASTSSLNSYKDSSLVSSWAKNDVSYAAENGILQGNDVGFLNSKNPVTRAETASMMERILKFANLI
ncbi:S-layer homology domain-containing protein [Paenibacillus sp. WLX2291]|uniref:S-layer homology domain-containing protein n=1 Tax=Paenibacillus sp. WLX2291 TaxID=3296934 RepID=UPI00398433BF